MHGVILITILHLCIIHLFTGIVIIIHIPTGTPGIMATIATEIIMEDITTITVPIITDILYITLQQETIIIMAREGRLLPEEKQITCMPIMDKCRIIIPGADPL